MAPRASRSLFKWLTIAVLLLGLILVNGKENSEWTCVGVKEEGKRCSRRCRPFQNVWEKKEKWRAEANERKKEKYIAKRREVFVSVFLVRRERIYREGEMY